MSARRAHGALAIVLHTHMPYVEGFGTWPFGEEWLWEAMATCYLPLLELLDAGAPLTLSLTPVLCDQLEAEGICERFVRFVEDVRRESHQKDIDGLRDGGYPDLAAELQRSYGDYERAAQRLADRGGDLLAAFAPYVQWTSAATHAVLPLLASDAGVAAQVKVGVSSHRARFGAQWRGGFWLPECAHAPHVEAPLAAAGARACCVELTDRPGFGLGAPAHLRPLRGESGLTLVPIDRQTMSLVWSEHGYPADGSYRDYHRHTVHHHNPWSNDGSPYDHASAIALARRHAADFVAQTRTRLANAAAAPERAGGSDGGGAGGGPIAVCALDTELLGHWWYEGIAWLEAVVEECTAQGLALMPLDEALRDREPQSPPRALREQSEAPSSWGRGNDLSTWSGPAVAELAFTQRAAELRLLAAGERAGTAAVRELMGLQASDWAFMVSRGLAVPYAHERLRGHLQGLESALATGPRASAARLRNLALHAGPELLRAI